MLPAATRAAHAARTGRAAFRARAADGDDLSGLRGSFPRGAVRAVEARARVDVRGVGVRGNLSGRRRSLRRGGRRVKRAAFDDERRRCLTQRATAGEAYAREREARGDPPQQAAFTKPFVARRAKTATRPQTPAQANNRLAALRAEVWPVHLREFSRDVWARVAGAAAVAASPLPLWLLWW